MGQANLFSPLSTTSIRPGQTTIHFRLYFRTLTTSISLPRSFPQPEAVPGDCPFVMNLPHQHGVIDLLFLNRKTFRRSRCPTVLDLSPSLFSFPLSPSLSLDSHLPQSLPHTDLSGEPQNGTASATRNREALLSLFLSLYVSHSLPIYSALSPFSRSPRRRREVVDLKIFLPNQLLWQ